MPSNFGYNFLPSNEQAQMASQGGVPGATPQGTIETLNFRMPKVAGKASANAISPLVGQGQMGSSISSAVLQSVLRTVLGVDQASALFDGREPGRTPGRTERDSGSAVLQALSGRGQPQAGPGAPPPFGAPPPRQAAPSPSESGGVGVPAFAAPQDEYGELWAREGNSRDRDVTGSGLFTGSRNQAFDNARRVGGMFGGGGRSLPANVVVENENDANFRGDGWYA